MAEGESQPLLVNTADEEVLVVGPEVSTSSNWKRLIPLNLLVFFYFAGVYPLAISTDQYIKQALSSNLTNVSRNHEECLAGNSTQYRDEQLRIASKSSMIMVAVNAAGLIPQFFTTFLLGSCSDQIGRKIALSLPPLGGCAKAVIYTLVVYFNLNPFYFCMGSFVEGLFGAFPLFFAACIAYTADVTDLSHRSFWICVLDVVIGLSAVLTTLAGGYIVTLLGFIWMFMTVAVTFGISTLIATFVIKESIAERTQVQIFTTIHLKRAIRVYSVDNGTNRRWKLLTLLLIIVLITLGAQENADASTFLLISTPVCFTPEILGFFVACLYVSKTVGGLGLMKMNHCGVHEGGLLVLSQVAYIVFQMIMAFAYRVETLFIGTVAGCATLLNMPLTRSLMSPLVSQEEQGALFAAATWVQNLSVLAASTYQNAVYAATVSLLRGFFLLVTAAVNALCAVVVVVMLILWKRDNLRKSQATADKLGSRYSSNGEASGTQHSLSSS